MKEKKESMLTKPQLLEQLRLQHRLNSVVNPLWIEARNPWYRAVMVEAVEALDHHGWKWWKASTPDLPQVQIELVDIWHFVLSAFLEEGRGDALTNRIKSAGEHAFYASYDTRLVFDKLISAASEKWFDASAFTKLMHRTGLDWAALHQMYLAKNILNLFRQAHGYTEGTYIKTWFGQEDNVVLANLIETKPDVTTQQLLEKLEFIYSQVSDQKEPA